MKLWLREENWPWTPERYHFSVEQMMLTLFPGERPEYPGGPVPDSLEENSAVLALSRDGPEACVTARVRHGGGEARGDVRFPAQKLDAPRSEVYHTVSHALKEAFYQAGVSLLGHELPWGALTGVRPAKLPTKAMLAGRTAEQAEAELREVYHVSGGRARLAVKCAGAALALKQSLEPDEVSLYVGIPFCPTRCAYCSFVSADVKRSLKLVEPYLDALGAEIAAAGAALRESGTFIRTLYIGGGTPTTLSPEQLERLLGQIAECIGLSRCTEYTVEAGRPDTITAEKLAVLKKYGVSRVSVNPQTMEDGVLRAMGRAHTAAQTLAAYELVRAAGFAQVNMDLIAGLPTDTPAGFRRTMDRVIALEPANITVHTLALKKSAALFQDRDALPSPQAVGDMLQYAGQRLHEAGYVPYYLYRQKYTSGCFENVGWCKPGTENGYNICMMEELHPVLALGAGGVTKLTDGAGQLRRLCNPKYPAEYLERLDRVLEDKKQAGDYLGKDDFHG